jgi:hypothetical protein
MERKVPKGAAAGPLFRGDRCNQRAACASLSDIFGKLPILSATLKTKE